MPLLCYSGVARVMDLVDAGVTLADIAVHPHAREFLAHHTQAKRILLKACMNDGDMRRWCRQKEARQRPFYVHIGR